MQYANVPEQLKAFPRWVTYKIEHKDGRKTKIPYNPTTGERAKAGQPQTWGRFEEAVSALNTGKYDGIGFEFHKDGFVGIDFDNCIENGVLNEWVSTWVARFNSYVEYSPSGTGIHIICEGKLPDKAIKRPEAEMYDCGRFFTVTGKEYGLTRPLREAQEAINALYEEITPKKQNKPVQTSTTAVSLEDSKLLEIAEKAKNGSTFTKLYQGDWQGLYKSQSEADMALCNMLAFYTGKDHMQMDRLFRSSGLMRDKWDRKQNGTTYGAITIQNAIDCCTEVYNPRKSPQEVFSVSVGDDISLNDCKGAHINLSIVKIALKELGITVRYNTLLKEIDIKGLSSQYSTNNASEILPVILIDYLKTFKIKGDNLQNVKMYLKVISDESRYNPFEELMKGAKWDNIDRLTEIYKILGVYDSKYQTYIKKWLLQSIALALNSDENPIGAEGVLVLQGEQGLAKTSFFRILSPFPQWFIEGAVVDMHDKDSIIKAVSGMLCELGELDSTLKCEQSSLKAFITQPLDTIRMPYAEKATKTPRRTSFCGTVNPQDYLRDETGSRRFWTIPVTKIDKQALFTLKREWVHQLWAQVYAIYMENKNGFRLTDDEMKTLQQDNQAFNVPLPYELEIIELFDFNLPSEKWDWWQAKDVAFRLGVKNDSRRIGKALSKVVDSEVLRNAANPTNTTTERQLKRKMSTNFEYFLPIVKYGSFECINGGISG